MLPHNKKTTPFRIAPSPFNAIKLELGIVIVMGALLLIALDSITEDALLQLSVLFVAGLLGMFWIMWRTHKVLKRQIKLPPTGESTDGKA